MFFSLSRLTVDLPSPLAFSFSFFSYFFFLKNPKEEESWGARTGTDGSEDTGGVRGQGSGGRGCRLRVGEDGGPAGMGREGESGHRQGAQNRCEKHGEGQRELLPSCVDVYASAPGPSSAGRAPVPCQARAPRLKHHFLFFFSFASLASSASWSLMSFTFLLPSGVLKYQSWWEEEGERGGHWLHPPNPCFCFLNSSSPFHGSWFSSPPQLRCPARVPVSLALHQIL